MHAHNPLNRLRKPPCVSKLSPEIQPAAKRENVSQCRVADLCLSRKFKRGVRAREELRATAAGARR